MGSGLIEEPLLPALLGCRQGGGAEVHLISDGFTGPVVVIYGVPGADSIGKSASGESLYEIGSDGVLFTSNPSFRSLQTSMV